MKTIRKRVVRKRLGRKRLGRKKLVRDELQITKFDMRHNLVVPSAFRTTLHCSWNSTESAAASKVIDFQIWANSPYQPYNVAGYPIGVTSNATQPGTVIDEIAGIASINSLGFSKFMNPSGGQGMYSTCHVMKAYIKVTYFPCALADALDASIIPQKDSDSAPVSSLALSQFTPYAKSKMITTSIPHKDMTVYNMIDIPKYLGIPEKAYLANPQFGVVAIQGSSILQPASYSADGARIFWTIRRVQLSGAVTNTIIPIRSEVTYDVVFQAPVSNDLNNT